MILYILIFMLLSFCVLCGLIFVLEKQIIDLRIRINEIEASLNNYINHNRRDITNWVGSMKKVSEDCKEFDTRLNYFIKRYIQT